MKNFRDVHMSFPQEFFNFMEETMVKLKIDNRSEFVRQAIRYYVVGLKKSGGINGD